jgi:hypothetical protein
MPRRSAIALYRDVALATPVAQEQHARWQYVIGLDREKERR